MPQRRRRHDAAAPGLPWAAGGPARSQPTLNPGEHWADRLTPLQGTPNFWGSTLRGDGIVARPGRRRASAIAFPVLWAAGSCVFFLFGWTWAGVAFAVIAAIGLARARWRWIPWWTWALVAACMWLFVLPLDFVHR
jgi:hypothetical protein